jgi:hypothetical protein
MSATSALGTRRAAHAELLLRMLLADSVLWQDRGVRRGWLDLAALCAVSAATALPACSGGTPVQRGFGSRQVFQSRDSTIDLLYTSGGDLVYFTTGYIAGLPPDQSPPATYWSIDLVSGEVTNLGTTMPDLTATSGAGGSSPTPRYTCTTGLAADGLTRILTVADTQTGTVTTIENASFVSPICPADDDPTLRFWRAESDGTYSLWIGPYTNPQQMALPIVVSELFWPIVGGTLVGVQSASATGLGIYQVLDADPSSATQFIPAELDSTAWAVGAAPSSTPLASSGVDKNYIVRAGPEHYSYKRAMADGTTMMFAGPYDGTSSPRELALFPVSAGVDMQVLQVEPYAYRNDGSWPQTANWNSLDNGSQTPTFRIWQDASQHLATCPWPGERYPVALGDPAGENVLFVNTTTSCCSLKPNSALLLMVPNATDGNPCRTLGSDGVSNADFSPDGTAMFWLIQLPTGRSALWTAARDGSGAREIGEGVIPGGSGVPGPPHFVGDSQLELTLDGDLSWVDVHDQSNLTQTVTERTFGVAVDLGRWVVTGHDYSNQDANGALAMVDRIRGDRGDTRAISPAVTQYTTPDVRLFGSTLGVFHDDGRPVRIVYLVRGRNPSPQDGIWIATITAQDRM